MNTKDITHKGNGRKAIWNGSWWILYGRHTYSLYVSHRDMAIRYVVKGTIDRYWEKPYAH